MQIQYALPRVSPGDFSVQLTHGFANSTGSPMGAAFNLGPEREISYHINNISNAGKWFAQQAMDAWSAVTGIEFVASSFASADIRFFDNDPSGAYASTFYNGSGDIIRANVNIPTWWINGDGYKLNNYSYQTYLHEIGHAIGLGHAGNYNGSASFPQDARFANDSWKMSVMSYFNQTDNPNVNASFAYVLTPMPADIIGVHRLYGTPTGQDLVNAGNTIWGRNSNAEGPAADYSTLMPAMAMTIFDQGGVDTLDFSNTGHRQIISLRPGYSSSVYGKVNNVTIDANTIIENAMSGAGADKLVGNAFANTLAGGAGSDIILGQLGADTLLGQGGWDFIKGGNGSDTISGDEGNDALSGDNGADTIDGGTGSDRVFGGFGDDELYGGIGSDTIYGQAGGDLAYGGDGWDLIKGGIGSDALYGGGGHDALHGEVGNDFLYGGDGSDRIFGGDGHDRLYGGDDKDTISGGEGADTISGEAGGDILIGNNGNDTVYGGNGNDLIAGGNGRDVLVGGSGNDRLNGEASQDRLNGGVGDDVLIGGAHADTFVFTDGHDIIMDFSDAQGDRIEIDDILLSESIHSFLNTNAVSHGNSTTLHFDNGDTLELAGVADPGILIDDIFLI